MAQPPIRVLLVEDHQIVREGLKGLLERQDDLEVVGQAGDGAEALRLAAELEPDVVVTDITMPRLNGVEATRQLVARQPGVRVIGLSVHSDRRFLTEMLKAGAAGYLPKGCAFRELAEAIRVVAGGKTYVSPDMAEAVVRDGVGRPAPGAESGLAALTPRAREVLQLLAEGLTTKEIAARLHLSVKTIESHRHRIMERLDIHSVAELTRWAIRHGLTPL